MKNENYTLTTTRTLNAAHASDGSDTHQLAVLQRDTDGTFWLHDLTADPNCDSLVQIDADHDVDISEAICSSGFQIVD